MFAQLGDHIFQGLKTPVSTSEADAVKYGQIPRVNDKDAIQPTGAELRELGLTITYSSEFCDPQAEIYALKASMHAFEVLPYITGDGRIVGDSLLRAWTSPTSSARRMDGWSWQPSP
jgi:Phage P2 GpU.